MENTIVETAEARAAEETAAAEASKKANRPMVNYFIGVTGEKEVYYTFWRVSLHAYKATYLGNLSHNYEEAVAKATERTAHGVSAGWATLDTEERLELNKASTIIGFGKYRGCSILELPADYLAWALKNVSHSSFTTRMKENIRKLCHGLEDAQKALQARQEAAQGTRGHEGTNGERMTLEGTISKVVAKEGMYGPSYPVTITLDNGNRAKFNGPFNWFDSGMEGKRVRVTGRAEHREYEGWKWTQLSRPKYELLG